MDEPLQANAVRKLDELEGRLDELERQSADPAMLKNPAAAGRIAREVGGLRKVVLSYREYKEVLAQLGEADQILAEDPGSELAELAREEVPSLRDRARAIAEKLLDLLLSDPEDTDRSVIMEIRAGTGGEEAALFAKDLFQMYSRFAASQGFKVEVLSHSVSEMGGAREIIFSVSGPQAWTLLRFESGGHRVQRVPATEAHGRIHTSAATVAVLPAVQDVEIDLHEKDLKIDTMRSGGAGGQHVNKTESAVRITHLPTGAVVVCQDERSQHKNRARAMLILRSRLYEMERRRREAERSAFRRSQVGSGDRNERIRTYNFPDNRVTDHRIHANFSLEQVLEGRVRPLIDRLVAHDREQRLLEI